MTHTFKHDVTPSETVESNNTTTILVVVLVVLLDLFKTDYKAQEDEGLPKDRILALVVSVQ